MQEILISKEALIKTEYYIEVSIDDGAGSIFSNLPMNYSKEDIIEEYERMISYDFNNLFKDCDVSMDNISYNAIASCIHDERNELFEDKYEVFLTSDEKELVKNNLHKYDLSGIYVIIDGKLYN